MVVCIGTLCVVIFQSLSCLDYCYVWWVASSVMYLVLLVIVKVCLTVSRSLPPPTPAPYCEATTHPCSISCHDHSYQAHPPSCIYKLLPNSKWVRVWCAMMQLALHAGWWLCITTCLPSTIEKNQYCRLAHPVKNSNCQPIDSRPTVSCGVQDYVSSGGLC